MTIGQSIRTIREEKGYSRQRLVNKSKVPYYSIRAWEKDICIPNILSMIDIADALGVSLDELVGRKMEEQK